MNISGNWRYTEDFAFGNSQGKAELQQEGETITGTFSFTEEVKKEYRIDVVEKVRGVVSNNKVLLESTEVRAIQDGTEIDYLPNTFEMHLVSENKLVGSTFDSEEVCGVFILERISY